MMPTDDAEKVPFEKTCDFCKKVVTDEAEWEKHYKGPAQPGNHDGDGQELGKNIFGMPCKRNEVKSKVREHNLHLTKWDVSAQKIWGMAPQAHHLICSEAMNNPIWEEICEESGYNINCKENGVYLPAYMHLACQLRIPLHRGGHSAGDGGVDNEGESLSYPDAVKKELKKLEESFGKFECNNQKGESIIKDLNALSREIFEKVKKFEWTITYDGFDYDEDSNIGCAGCTTLKAKKEKFKNEYAKAAKQVNHNKRLAGDEAILKINDKICLRRHFLDPTKKYPLTRGK